jgi:hypothetical protein
LAPLKATFAREQIILLNKLPHVEQGRKLCINTTVAKWALKMCRKIPGQESSTGLGEGAHTYNPSYSEGSTRSMVVQGKARQKV